MTSHFFLRFIKTLMVTTPFLAMIVMVLALWGVGGKTTYADLNFMNPKMAFSEGEAKNYLVKGTKSGWQSPTHLENHEINAEAGNCGATKIKPPREKINWRLVV
ncbi:MAG: hypothetical protein ABL903_13845 [Methylococcales bacterium]